MEYFLLRPIIAFLELKIILRGGSIISLRGWPDFVQSSK